MAPEASAPDISVRNLTKRYGEVVAVDGVDLDIPAGEFFTLLGSSGSGKTTTLRLIAGFELPDDGTTCSPAWTSPAFPVLPAVHTVFQDYALFPHITVEENIAFALMGKKIETGDRHRWRQTLEMVQLGGFGERKPGATLRRAAPAHRARPRDRQPPEGAAPRRAARRPRSKDSPGGADELERSSATLASRSCTSRTTRRRR